MSAKHLNKKTTRQKKLIHTVAALKNNEGSMSFDLNSTAGREAAIVRQFNLIQKDYLKLMNDVAKEFDLVKGWIGTQAMMKRDEIKTKLSTRLSRD